MLHDTPLRSRHEAYVALEAARETTPEALARRPGAAAGRRAPAGAVEYVSYGPRDEDGLVTCEIVSTFGPVEAEYAAIRRGAGLVDAPHRATIQVRGADRRDFVNRVLTQALADLEPGVARASFWLNRKGRIEADLLLIELGDVMLIDVDAHQVKSVVDGLDAFLFTEDVEIADASDELHHVSIHGPEAPHVLASLGEAAAPEPGRAARLRVEDVELVAVRRDQTGGPGYELLIPRAEAGVVWDALLERDELLADGRRRIRPAGWFAYNVARIEGGTPLCNIDFGTTSVPHETGVLHDRVSFKKGCYVGQEIVARMENLGRPKRMLVGLRLEEDRLPVAESAVFDASDDDLTAEPVGIVTSSSLSPMLGARPIAFATLRASHADEGTSVRVSAEGDRAMATVTGLRFWPPSPDTAASGTSSAGEVG